jgi:hypothetical protein
MVGGVGSAVATAGTICLLVFRYHRVQRTELDREIHNFCHSARDEAAKIHGSEHPNEAIARFESFSNSMAQHIADAFRVMLRKSYLTCTIRLAVLDQQEKWHYATAGRSNGQEPSRVANSAPIPADMGLPARLRSANHQGVLIVKSVKDAIESRDYHETVNDKLGDCGSLIICPINGWENGEKKMIGTLSVASKKKDGFEAWQTTALKSFADVLGLVYPSLMARLVIEPPSKESAVPMPHIGKAQSKRRGSRK